MSGVGKHEGPQGPAGQGAKGISLHVWTLVPVGGHSQPGQRVLAPLSQHCAATGRPRGCLPCGSDHSPGQLLPCPPACPSCSPGMVRQQSASRHGSALPACLHGPSVPVSGSHSPSSPTCHKLWSLSSKICGRPLPCIPTAALHRRQRLFPASCCVSHALAVLGLL